MELSPWKSRILRATLTVARHGFWGPPLVYFPTSGGDHTEFARYGFPDDAQPWLAAGRVQVFAVDGWGPQSFYNDALHPMDRVTAYARYERAIRRELLPWVLGVAKNEYLGAVGCSYGAFVAANLFYKQPGLVKVGGGLSGVYAMRHRLDGYHDDRVYFHTPLEYLARLDDDATRAALNATRGFLLYSGELDQDLVHTHEFSHLLRERGLRHETEVWEAPAAHHESTWKQQLPSFLAKAF